MTDQTKVLIVDDSRTMRNFLSAIVSSLNFTAEQAGDGVEALEKMSSQGGFDLALVDWDMPRMNGLEFLRSVRADPQLRGVKLLMVTSHSSGRDIEQALESGADDYLMKPVTSEMVEEKLRLVGVLA